MMKHILYVKNNYDAEVMNFLRQIHNVAMHLKEKGIKMVVIQNALENKLEANGQTIHGFGAILLWYDTFDGTNRQRNMEVLDDTPEAKSEVDEFEKQLKKFHGGPKKSPPKKSSPGAPPKEYTDAELMYSMGTYKLDP